MCKQNYFGHFDWPNLSLQEQQDGLEKEGANQLNTGTVPQADETRLGTRKVRTPLHTPSPKSRI
jgi:hypothetical protein